MRYFLPDIELPPGTQASPRPGLLARLLGGKQPSPEIRAASNPVYRERLGGLPAGLPPDRWPRCSKCGKSQTFLAQFEHHPERLDLGRTGRMLYVFQCSHDPGMCESWEAFSGANAIFVVEPEDMSPGETMRPDDLPPLEHPVLIAGWVERDDGLTADEAQALYSDAGTLGLSDETLQRISTFTQLGGVPNWIQSCEEYPRPDWRFIGQLDSVYSFLRTPWGGVEWVNPELRSGVERTSWAEGPNFGDSGMAYLFLRDTGDVPEAAMFWQCF